jgi:hypothetical protein
MKLTKHQKKKYLDFMNHTKRYIGLSDWNVIIKSKIADMDKFATVMTDMYEKELVIELSIDFMKFHPDRQKNILFHELTHARMSIIEIKIDEFKTIEVEHCVNDIVRGFEKMKLFKNIK